MPRPSNPHSKRFYPAQEDFLATGNEKSFAIMYDEVLQVSEIELHKLMKKKEFKLSEDDIDDTVCSAAAIVMARYRKGKYIIRNLSTMCLFGVKTILWSHKQKCFEDQVESLSDIIAI